ncbi:hypothetical protein V6N13_018804 [Hibiscus sabdariffa]|uniref:Uncharacterized protein n=1 Tax=Hibiscus sabdariffa TaxID=183260 RepID=A0ABR2EKU7_9ROSI
MVRRLDERRGCVIASRGISEFCDFMEVAALSDVPLQGKVFTWFESGNKCSRLDRFLVSNYWFQRFDSLVVVNLPRELSDHSPIILVSDVCDSGPKPFRFFNAWLLNLQHIRDMECVWQVAEIEELDTRLNNGELGSSELKHKRKLYSQLWSVSRLQKSVWRQKSRAVWLAEGDRNTDYFHRQARIRMVRNGVMGIQYNRRWETSPERVNFFFAGEFIKHFA